MRALLPLLLLFTYLPAAHAGNTGTTERLRGLSAVDAHIAWASGAKGTVIRTTDGGKSWQNRSVPNAAKLDFRDIHAFSALEAVAMAAGPGEASSVYRTVNGGKTWKRVLQNETPEAFFDCMAFEGNRGWMLGDPINGKFQIYETSDRGAHWALSKDGPKAATDEAAFAASGTCIARQNGKTLVVTGGAESRVHIKPDGKPWQWLNSGMSRQQASAGVFSIAPANDGLMMMMVGGDYKTESAPGNAAWFHGDYSEALKSPRGYRSGVSCIAKQPWCIAVGPSGTDLWSARDNQWRRINDDSHDSIEIRGNVVWMSGAKGRVTRLDGLKNLEGMEGTTRK